MNPQTISRTAAVIYAESDKGRKVETIRKKFVESVFVSNGNSALSIQEIGNYLQVSMGLTFSDSEIENSLHDPDVFLLQQYDNNKYNDKYCLVKQRYDFLLKKSNDNIDRYLTEYLEKCDNPSIDSSDKLKGLLQKYLYYLMNSNIKSFQQVLGCDGIEKTNGRVNPEDFTDEEIDEINDFLSWNNSAKDKELYKLVSCCIEYAMAVNNTNEKNIIQAFRNKTLYLDNAFIYRAIGINGETRKKRTITFIQKCRETGQNLVITKFSREEFFESIEYHIRLISKTTPFGRINPSLFQRYSNGDTIYQFYHKWRANRIGYGFEMFKNYIISEYNNLLQTYGIIEDFKIPFDPNKTISDIEKYSEEIGAIKKRGHVNSHVTDARNMYWIEKIRNGCDGRIVDTKFYFITPDQKLQLWDNHHSINQPLTLLPSQWLALLLKFTSRSNDDYLSYVSFLKMSRFELEVTSEQLQEILSGISEITEDINRQGNILDIFVESEWRNLRKGSDGVSLREEAKQFAKDKQEEYYQQKLMQQSEEMSSAIQEAQQNHSKRIEEISLEYQQHLDEIERKHQIELLQTRLGYLKERCAEQTIKLNSMKTRKENIDTFLNKYLRRIKWITFAIVLLILIVWIVVVLSIGWEKMEIITYIVGAVIAVLSTLYGIIYEKRISLHRTFSTIISRKRRKQYAANDLSDDTIFRLTQECNDLSDEINEITTRINILNDIK